METKKTNKEKAFELFEQGASDQMVGSMLNLTENTVRTYHSHYRKMQKEQIEQVEQVEQEVVNEDVPLEVLESDYIPEEVCMIIGKDVYNMPYYIDVRDGSNWFDYAQIITALRTENIIPPVAYNSNIADRYFRDEKINGKSVSLIDKNILMELAQNIGDYTFINAVMALFTGTNKDVFFNFSKIVDAFELVEHFISNDNIDKRFNEVKAFNTGQLDFLHEEVDNDPFATEEQLLEKMQKLKSLRMARRAVKNELTLSQCLRGSLRYYKVNCAQIYNVRQKVSKLLDDLYAKKYNSRLDNLDEWQKEIVDKVIDNEFNEEETN